LLKTVFLHPSIFNHKVIKKNPLLVGEIKSLLHRIKDNPMCIMNPGDGALIKQADESFISKLDQNHKSSFRISLRNLKDEKRIVNVPKLSNSALVSHSDWIGEAVNINNQCQFDLFVAQSEVLEKYSKKLNGLTTCPIEDAPNHNIFENISWSKHQSISKSNVEESLDPFLKFSKLIKIIDPYIGINLSNHSSNANFDQFIEAISKTKNKYNSIFPVEIIEVHTSIKIKKDTEISSYEKESFIEFFQKNLSLLRGEDVDISIYLWLHHEYLEKNKKRIHNRYLLTDRFGLSIPHGTDIDEQKKDTWNLLGNDEIEKVSLDYNPNYSSFDLIKKIELP
jgi:hypothetical protein